MGGECSQKLRPWRGMTLLSGAQQTSGSVENQHSTSKSLALRPEDHLRIYFFIPASGGAGYDCGFSFPETSLVPAGAPWRAQRSGAIRLPL
jgi:hypothetical protein